MAQGSRLKAQGNSLVTGHWSLVTDRGQALLELAIFGSLMIMVLGLLVRYGFNADANQQVMMRAFRRAFNLSAAVVGSASVAVIKDSTIPNPNHPFAVGSIFPVSASASVTRDYRLHETADTPEELPQLVLEINDTAKSYTVGTAPFICDGEILDLSLLIASCKKDSSPWCCQKLQQLFAANSEMGLQVGAIRSSQTDTSLNKVESSSGVTTTSHVGWQETMQRRVVIRPKGDQSGATTTETISTTPKHQDATTILTTPWN